MITGGTMKILFLAAGNNAHTIKWVNELARIGHEVHLVYQKQHIPKSGLIDKKVIQYTLPVSGNAGYYMNCFFLKKIYTTIKPDIINAHYASGYGTLARISKLKPLVLSVWGSDVYDFPYQSKLKYNIIKKNLLFADKIASTSHIMAKQIHKLVPDINKDIAITPFGVDLELFPLKPQHDEEENKIITIGIVKALAPKYGIEYLIKAFKILIDHYKNSENEFRFKLVIYGKGDQLNSLKELACNLGIENLVDFKGYIDNSKVSEALNKITIFALPSIRESFGVAAIEAMAVGVPVVATDADGFREVIVDGESGLIVPKKDSEAMAKALKKLVDDKELRIRFRETGRKRVEELYDLKKNLKTMETLYSETLSKQRRSRI